MSENVIHHNIPAMHLRRHDMMLEARDSIPYDDCQLQNAAERDSVHGHTGLPKLTVKTSAMNEVSSWPWKVLSILFRRFLVF